MNIHAAYGLRWPLRRAFRFYHQVFGGELVVMPFGESPVRDEVPAEHRDRTMHAITGLSVGGQLLMGSDTMPGEPL